MGASDFREQHTLPIACSADYLALAEDPTSGRYGEQIELCQLHQPPHTRHGRPDYRWCPDLDRPTARYRPPRPSPAPASTVSLDRETVFDIADAIARLLRSGGRP